MKYVLLKIIGSAAALAMFFILIQSGVAQDLKNYQCGMEEHTHDASCYESVLICELDENEPHSHGPSCYDEREERVCNPGDDEEHEHTDSCWKSREELICDLSEEKGHIHTSACEQESLICGYSEHIHSDECVGTAALDELEGPEDMEITMEDFLDNFTSGSYAFGNDVAPPPGRGAMMKMGGASDTWDLANFVTGIIIKDDNGNPVTDGNFYYGTNYTFNMLFAERPGLGGQFEYNLSGKLVYQFPEQIIVKQPITNGVIKGTNGIKIGDYTVDTSGRMEIWFGKFDAGGNAITQNFIDYYTNTTIRLDIGAQFTQNIGPILIDFGMDTGITINLSPPPAGVKVKKASATFDTANETLDYSVEITALKGNLTGLALTDTIKIYNPAKPGDSFQVKVSDIPSQYANPYGNVTYKINNGTPVNASITPSGNDMKLNFSGETLAEDAVIKVEYRLDLKDILDHIAGLSGSDTWFQRSDYSLMIENTASVSGVNADQPTQTVTGSDTARTPAAYSLMTKKGIFLQDTKRIEWTVSVGDGFTTLSGLNITDVLKNNQSIAGNITLNVWNTPPTNGVWGAPTHTATTASSISGMTVDQNVNGGFTFNVPGTVAGAGPVYRIDFIYQTSQAQDYSNGSYFENDISVTVGGYTSTKTGRVNTTSYSAPLTFAKSSRFIYDGSGTPTDIVYTASYNVAAGIAGAKIELSDTLSLTLGNENIVYGIYHRPKDINITIEPADPGFTYFISPEDLSTSTNNRVTIFPYSTSAERAVWPHNDQRTVTFTYTIALDDTPATYNSTVKLREMLEKGYSLLNVIDAGVSDLPSGTFSRSPSGAFDYISVIKKSGAQSKNDASVIDYKVVLNAAKPDSQGYQHTGFDGYPLFLADQPAIFEDTFDKNLEYVPGSFHVVREASVKGNAEQKAPAYYGPYDASTTADLVTVTGNTIRVDFRYMCHIASWGGCVSESSGLAATDSPTNSSNLYKYWYAFDQDGRAFKYTVYYQLRPKNGYIGYQGEGLSDTLKVNNTARVLPTHPKFSGGKWESSTSVDYTLPKAVTKKMEVNGNIAKTEIIINPGGARMRPLNVASPRFTAIDIMSDTMALYQGSVKIYTKGTDGNWNTTPETPQPDGLWDVSFVSGQETRFELKDEEAIRITYESLILTPAGQSTSIYNKITVYGQTTGATKDNFIVQSSDSETEGSLTGLTLYKRDQDTGARLPGARFDLYMALKSGISYDGIQTLAITAGGTKFYFVEEVDDEGKTSNGIYKFNNNWIRRDANPANNAVYLIRETRSPGDDYICPDPDDPANYTYFILDPADKAYWEGVLGKTVHVFSDNCHLTNKSTLGDVIISGEKRLTGTIPEDQSVTFWFELTQVDSDGSPYSGTTPAVLKAPLYTNVPMTTDSIGEYVPETFTFSKISGLANGDYYFKVEEVNTPMAWLAMTAPQIVRVNVFAGEAILYYPDDEDKVIFENKYRDPAAPFADVSIPVNKRVDCEEFDHTKQFIFEIEQVVEDMVNGGFEPGTSNGYTLPEESENIIITGDGMGVFILENLPAPKGHPAGTVWTFYFRVGEIDESAKDSTWRYDQTKYIVKADVTFDKDRGGKAELTYLKDDSWEDFEMLTFTNSCVTGGPKIPETGGIVLMRTIFISVVWAILLILSGLTSCRRRKY